jgi:hypothetical protein
MDILNYDDVVMMMFITWLTLTKKVKSASVKSYISAVKSMRVNNLLPEIAIDYNLKRRVLQGAKLVQAPQDNSRKRQPITKTMLLELRMCKGFLVEDYKSKLYWFASLLAVNCLLRMGELTLKPDWNEAERKRRVLRWRHVVISGDGPLLVGSLYIPVSKTDITGQGNMLLFYPTSLSLICPINAYYVYKIARLNRFGRIEDDSPLLLCEDGVSPLYRKELISAVQAWIATHPKYRLVAKLYNGHSFRKGGAQSLADANVSANDIKRAGRWKSNAAQLYYSYGSSQSNILAEENQISANLRVPYDGSRDQAMAYTQNIRQIDDTMNSFYAAISNQNK